MSCNIRIILAVRSSQGCSMGWKQRGIGVSGVEHEQRIAGDEIPLDCHCHPSLQVAGRRSGKPSPGQASAAVDRNVNGHFTRLAAGNRVSAAKQFKRNLKRSSFARRIQSRCRWRAALVWTKESKTPPVSTVASRSSIAGRTSTLGNSTRNRSQPGNTKHRARHSHS